MTKPTSDAFTWLIIDDDEVFSRVLKRSLTKYEYQVQYRPWQRTSLYKVLNNLYRIILFLTPNIGQSNGIELITPLLMRAPNAKILMLTGYASIATAVNAVKLGAYQYLPKPCGIDNILTALDIAPAQPSKANIDERLSLEHHEWEYIYQVLDECDGNISEAATHSKDAPPRTLQRKLQKKRKIISDDFE